MEIGVCDKPAILVVTDRIGPELTNGAQVFADALVRELAQWFDVHVLVTRMKTAIEGLSVIAVKDQDIMTGLLPSLLRHPSVIYNLGGTIFSCRVTRLAMHIWPDAQLINHFQLNLAAYARWEQVASHQVDELALHQPELAALAAVNLFPSFSELALASQTWRLAQSFNYVLPNAFVPAAGKDPGEKGKGPIFTFLAAGRFSDFVKGADMLYRAFTQVYASHPVTELVVVADGERFTEIMRGLPAGAWARHPWMARDRLHAIMRTADVVIVPSRYEPFGLVALEAMAMGTPVIAMAVGGLREIIHNQKTGWLCSPHEGSFGLAEAMRAAITAGHPTVHAMGEAAALVARRDYALEGVAGRVRAIFDNLPPRHGTMATQTARGSGTASRQGGVA